MNPSGLECPACGIAATEVSGTESFATFVLRNRRCLLCGYRFQTVESAESFGRAMRLMLNLLDEQKEDG